MISNGFAGIENNLMRRMLLVICFPFMFFFLPPLAIVEGVWKGFKESFTFAKDLCVACKEIW
tara:strand:+ start:222 stop:407 length:186 start_codon:yes stop_codon:yes gene_type:complete